MARVLRMPGGAGGTDPAALGQWLVAEAGDFSAAEPIATVETDKAAVEVEADAAGRLLTTLVAPGTEVPVGDPIAVLGDPGEEVDDLPALLASLGVDGGPAPAVADGPDRPTDPGSATPLVEEPEPEVPQSPPPAPERSRRIFSSPLARRLAAEAGLALEDIPGSGPRGRVLRRDVDAAVAARAASPEPDPATSPSVAASAEYEEVPHTRVRLVTARRLTESVREAPHFSLRASVRADRLLALRAELADDAATRVSLTDLVVRAVALAHARVPDMNVTWTDTAVRRYARADIGIAVDTEHGLLVPVLRDAGALGVAGLAARVRDLAERARGRRLRPEELEGGSITVTNLGMFGVERFSGVINPPHAAILAVGAVREEPVVVDGALAVGRVLRLTLTVDHRPVDGALAARWLAVLVELLEHPVRLLV